MLQTIWATGKQGKIEPLEPIDLPEATKVIVTFEDNRTNTIRVWKRIPEFGNRALRVVYNPNTEPITVVTVFFDRGYKR